MRTVTRPAWSLRVSERTRKKRRKKGRAGPNPEENGAGERDWKNRNGESYRNGQESRSVLPEGNGRRGERDRVSLRKRRDPEEANGVNGSKDLKKQAEEEITMLAFECDYLEGAHEKILNRLIETNMEKLPGYGADPYCASAREKILDACQCPEGEVFFLVGGTQTNATVIDGLLSSYEGVVSAETGHVNCHESGAIEASGHKVITLPHHEGKLDAGELEALLKTFWGDETHEHMVFPGMVYISHPTEYGTLYTKNELKGLHQVCKAYGIPLYMDGARLGYGLAAHGTDVTLPVIAEYCDAFYIGGTKVGALCGEAVVFPKKEQVPKHFFTIIKQHGALLAKRRLLGIQFDTLFTDGLYMEVSRHAIQMAEVLKQGLKEKGYGFHIGSPTNQQFVILENKKLEELRKEVSFSIWEKKDADHTVVRFATSWATKEEDIRKLLALM